MLYTEVVNKKQANARLEKAGKGAAIVASIVAISLLGLYFLINSRKYQVFGSLVSHVDTTDKVVALTFDDGPSDATDEILAIMAQRQAKGTFYVVGQNIAQYPQQTKDLVAAGMELGNHTFHHEPILFKSQSAIDREIQSTNQLIRAAGYQGPITFRPPFGKKLVGLPWYLRQHQIPTIMWDVESDTVAEVEPDVQRRAALLIEYTLSHVKPGSIVLLHPFWGYGTADRLALGQIIDGLQERGYRLVTVSELLASQKR